MNEILAQTAIENVNTRVTVLTRIDGKPAGKTYSLSNGAVGKTVADHAGIYTAETIIFTGTPADILEGYRALVESLTPAQSIILGDAPEAEGHPYRILPARKIDANDARPVGMRVVNGVPSMSRLKENFIPSRIVLLDFDPDPRMPEIWINADEQGRWDLFTAACPEFAGAARLTIGSGSSRVLLPNGEPAKGGASGSHTYVVLDRELTTDELDALRTNLVVRLWARELGFMAESKAGAALTRTLFDASVWLTGRELFDGPPKILAPLKIAPLTAQIFAGGFASPITAPTDADTHVFSERTGARVVRAAKSGKGNAPADGTGGVAGATDDLGAVKLVIEDHTTLRMTTVVVTERGPLSIKAFLDSGADKLRCQATFRESSSWAGILRRTHHGAVLHDVGTGTTYRMCSDPADGTGGFLEACEALEKQSPANAHGYARAILFRQAWRCPVQMGFDALVKNLADAHPAVDKADLEAICAWLEAKGRKAALTAVTIDAKALPHNVILHRAADIESVYAGIMDAGEGIHLCKAPHGSGKTQSLLKPIALACSEVVAIAPRVSLVADLSERLQLANYQSCTPGAPDLAVCLNSIANPKHAQSVGNAAIVLIDEVARVTRECHTPSSTLKKNAAATWDRLIRMIVNADLALGVDADINTADVAMIAAAVAGSGRATAQDVHLWIVEESARDKRAEFIHEDALLTGMYNAIDADETVLFVTDQAGKLAGYAEDLRARYPEKTIIDVQSRAGVASTGTEAVTALLRNINEGVKGVDVLLLSPAVESGVSLNEVHFTRHFALYGGTVEPSAFNQMLLRDRTAKTWQIAIAGKGFANFADSMGEALNGLAASQRRVMALADEGGEFGRFVPNTTFDLDCCKTISAANGARNRYGADIYYLLEARGWTVGRSSITAAPGAGKEIRQAGREAFKAKIEKAIGAAPDKGFADIETLREKYAQTPEESAIVARFDVRESTGISTGISTDIGADDIDLWQDGKLMNQNKLVADITADEGVSERDKSDAAAAVPVSLRSFDAARGEAVRALFAALGIDPVSGAGTITAASALTAFNTLKGTEQGHVLTHFGICRFNRVPAQPVRWAGDALAKFGLWLIGQGHDGRGYAIAKGEKRSKTGVFQLPGWDLMMQIKARRELAARSTPYKALIETAASLPPSASQSPSIKPMQKAA